MLSHSEAMAIQREPVADRAAKIHAAKQQEAMEQTLKGAIAQQVASHANNMFGNAGFINGSGTSTSTGHRPKPTVHRRVDRAKTRSRIVSYSDGYWAKITINDTDHVTYKLFNSGWLAKVFHKIGFRKVLDSSYDSVKQRDSIEATLGATYMAIDEAIAEDLRKSKHSKFLKDMIKTDPDNLKAIAQLDMLDKGDGPGAENSGNDDRAPTMGPIQYANNITASGTGTLMKTDQSKPASITTGPMSFGAGSSNNVSFSGEESIKVDSEGEISFGNKMAQAIKEVVQIEQGETDVT